MHRDGADSDLGEIMAVDDGEEWTKQLREFLNRKASWSDERIWQTLTEIYDENLKEHPERITARAPVVLHRARSCRGEPGCEHLAFIVS